MANLVTWLLFALRSEIEAASQGALFTSAFLTGSGLGVRRWSERSWPNVQRTTLLHTVCTPASEHKAARLAALVPDARDPAGVARISRRGPLRFAHILAAMALFRPLTGNLEFVFCAAAFVSAEAAMLNSLRH